MLITSIFSFTYIVFKPFILPTVYLSSVNAWNLEKSNIFLFGNEFTAKGYYYPMTWFWIILNPSINFADNELFLY